MYKNLIAYKLTSLRITHILHLAKGVREMKENYYSTPSIVQMP